MPSSNPPIPAATATDGPGHCLVEPETGRLVAVDSQVAAWLGVQSNDLGKAFLGELVPSLSMPSLSSQLTGNSPEQLTRETSVNCGKPTPLQAEVALTPLIGFAQKLFLVTIRPLDWEPGEPLHLDALTGLPDRRELANQRSRWRRIQPEQPIPHAVLFIDLDGFKAINDCHGHALGDRVLVSLASRWQECIREDDLLVRYGGDEFVILLAGICEEKEVQPIVERLVDATAEPIELDNLQLKVSATIGVALADDTTVDLDQLLAEADRAMYERKRRR